jgi:carboxynorspermidine decarboxylase
MDNIKWLNMGGGHHITRHDYDIACLKESISHAQKTWNVTVYLEPGEACALNAGYLATRVLDVTKNADVKLAILDASAACHMPDVIEMPYVPPLYGAENADETDSTGLNGDSKGTADAPFVYRLGGPTCLSGDVIGNYRFKEALTEGDLLLFGDMAIYTTCKNNTFNGMSLPSIMLYDSGSKNKAAGCPDTNFTVSTLADFGYSDFKSRLGSHKENGR